VEFNSFGPAVGRLGSDSSRGGANSAKVEAGGVSPPLAPLTLTTARRLLYSRGCLVMIAVTRTRGQRNSSHLTASSALSSTLPALLTLRAEYAEQSHGTVVASVCPSVCLPVQAIDRCGRFAAGRPADEMSIDSSGYRAAQRTTTNASIVTQPP